MASLQNPSFETPGVSAGQAGSWTEVQSSGAENIGTFSGADGDSTHPYEGFEAGWTSNEDSKAAFEDGDLTPGAFGGGHNASETFESSWAEPESGPPYNHQSISVYDEVNFSVGGFDASYTPEAVEDFEEGWDSNEDAVAAGGGTFASGDFTGAEGAVSTEDFQYGWQDNEDAVSGPSAGAYSAGTFTGGLAYENFSGAWTETLD